MNDSKPRTSRCKERAHRHFPLLASLLIYVALTYQAVPDGIIRGTVVAVGRRIARLFDEEAGQVWYNRVARITESDSGPPQAVPVLDGIPDPTTLIFASGFRNSQALAWLPDGETLLAIDHGPTGLAAEGLRRGVDELNRVLPGAEYGWPEATGYETAAGSRPALLAWTPALAPAGLTVSDAPGSAWHGDAFVTALRGTELRRVVLEGPGAEGVLCEESLLAGTHGRLRAVRQGLDGALHMGTSKRDQRGMPGPADDLLLRIQLLPAHLAESMAVPAERASISVSGS